LLITAVEAAVHLVADNEVLVCGSALEVNFAIICSNMRRQLLMHCPYATASCTNQRHVFCTGQVKQARAPLYAQS
jgi:hypothetical protein